MSKKRWEAAYYHDQGVRTSRIHVLPLDDSEAHIEEVYCPCRPTELENGEVVRHNAFDGREYDEPDFTP